KSALCFLFPSRIEGFGLPLVEAMACGCPVVASNSSCLPEIGGDAALYCDPDDADGWITKILQLRYNNRLRESLILRGFERPKRASWERVAQVYLQLMADIDEATPSICSLHNRPSDLCHAGMDRTPSLATDESRTNTGQ